MGRVIQIRNPTTIVAQQVWNGKRLTGQPTGPAENG